MILTVITFVANLVKVDRPTPSRWRSPTTHHLIMTLDSDGGGVLCLGEVQTPCHGCTHHTQTSDTITLFTYLLVFI